MGNFKLIIARIDLVRYSETYEVFFTKFEGRFIDILLLFFLLPKQDPVQSGDVAKVCLVRDKKALFMSSCLLTLDRYETGDRDQ